MRARTTVGRRGPASLEPRTDDGKPIPPAVRAPIAESPASSTNSANGPPPRLSDGLAWPASRFGQRLARPVPEPNFAGAGRRRPPEVGLPAEPARMEVTETGFHRPSRSGAGSADRRSAASAWLVALDDSGPATQHRLPAELPFDKLKLDRSLIVGIAEDEPRAALAKATVGLARSAQPVGHRRGRGDRGGGNILKPRRLRRVPGVLRQADLRPGDLRSSQGTRGDTGELAQSA